MNQEKINNLVITISASAQLLHELLDELEETTYFKQSLKMATKRLQVELTKTCDNQTNDLWSADSDSMVAIQDGIHEMIKQAIKADPVRIAAMGDLLRKNPDALNLEPA